MQKYNNIIDVATKTYYEQNSSVRMKMMEKQAKRLVKSDMKIGSTKGVSSDVTKPKNTNNPTKEINDIMNLRASSISKVISNAP